MINLSTVDHINMNVDSIEKTQEFYGKHFGLTLKKEGKSSNGSPYKIIGLKNKIYLCLYEYKYQKEARGHINHIGFQVDDFEKTLQYLEENDVKITDGPFQYPNSKSVYIEDNNGFEIELTEVFGGGLN